MGAFIVAGVIIAGTFVLCILIIMADGMSDAPSSDGVPVLPTLIGGTIIAGIVLASHWLPHIGW